MSWDEFAVPINLRAARKGVPLWCPYPKVDAHEPRGVWTFSRNRASRAHLTSQAFTLTNIRGATRLGIFAKCGYMFADAATGMEPPDYGDLCDMCLLDGFAGFAVYRFYDAAGSVLYIGYTANLAARAYGHQMQSAWWPAVSSWRYESFDTELAARRAEVRAIETEQPPYNTAGTTRDQRRSLLAA